MKQMTDNELDSLIRATLERERMISNINKNVVKEIRRSSLKARGMKWAKMLAVAFGVPLTVAVLAFAYYRIFVEMSEKNIFLLCLAIPMAALLYCAKVAITNFSTRNL